MTTVFVPKESRAGETRVALSPESAKRLCQAKLEVVVESGAGARAGFPDAAFTAAGARVGTAWESDLVLKVQPPGEAEVARLRKGAILVAFLQPHRELDVVARLCSGQVTALAMELVPRISRAQSMDALSSQATIAGYKAVLLGAVHLRKLCPLLMTAAGTVQPARVVVFGAGVAGLMAIATARRLGCKVEATDVRMAAKEQSPEFLRRQREEVAKRVAEADLVITTAQIPGKSAPRLVDAAMVRSMRPGSVVVDLAVESGGNCELSEPGQVVEREGVTLVGLANLPASVPQHASELYARNVLALVKLLLDKEGQLAPDWTDEVLAGSCLTRAGEIQHAPTAAALAARAGA